MFWHLFPTSVNHKLRNHLFAIVCNNIECSFFTLFTQWVNFPLGNNFYSIYRSISYNREFEITDIQNVVTHFIYVRRTGCAVDVWVEKFKFKLCSNDFQLLSIYYRYNMHCYCSSKCRANNHHIVHNDYYSYRTYFDAKGSWVVCPTERQDQWEKKISIYNICIWNDAFELCGCTFCALCVLCAILLCFRLQYSLFSEREYSKRCGCMFAFDQWWLNLAMGLSI